jgi:hypothetical protein
MPAARSAASFSSRSRRSRRASAAASSFARSASFFACAHAVRTATHREARQDKPRTGKHVRT